MDCALKCEMVAGRAVVVERTRLPRILRHKRRAWSSVHRNICSDWKESTRYCGVCTANGVRTPFFGSSQKAGQSEAGAERYEHVLRHVPACSPTVARACAVDVQVQRGAVESLLHCTSTAQGIWRISFASFSATKKLACWL